MAGYLKECSRRLIHIFLKKFLWSKDGDQRGLLLLAWEKLCKRKVDGGLGLRQMRSFHVVLVGKQLSKYVE